MCDPKLERDKELTRIRKEIIRTTREIIRLARAGRVRTNAGQPVTVPNRRSEI